MRLIAALAFLVLCCAPASAHRYHHHYRHHHFAHRHHVHPMVMALGHGFIHMLNSMPPACHEAAREGGPCGCWAENYFFHTTQHVLHGWNAWLADAWLPPHFPRTEPAPGTAAIWPHHHVAPVIAVAGPGRIIVHDSWGDHEVRTAGLVFVRPR